MTINNLSVSSPLVTVICLCYNQAAYVKEALFSVVNQTYPNVELIIADDASTDGSLAVIQSFIEQFPQTKLLTNRQNSGNCRTFNQALALARGTYIIDLAADDVLLDTRLEKQVSQFEQLDELYGVGFTNALYMDEQSRVTGYHYPVTADGKAKTAVPSGDVYAEILKRYFICTPTMMMRKSVLDALGGYDEKLSYEDFDFWVRSARRYKYFYVDEPLTMKRRVNGSLSTKFYAAGQNAMLASTLRVCEKAERLNQTPEENAALAICVRYHLRQSFYTQNFELVHQYAALLKRLAPVDRLTQVVVRLSTWKVPVTGLYRGYLKMVEWLNGRMVFATL